MLEAEFIAWLRENVPSHRALMLGIGDDAAVVDLGGKDAIVTTDMLMDGVDFELSRIDARQAGRKALAVNLSDLAAMAARPVAAFVSVALPRQNGLELAKALYEGILPLAAEFDVCIAGGDTNSWDGPLVISIMAIGQPSSGDVWRRSGAKSGDVLLVTGPIGGSILGKHLDFTPRVREALSIAERYPVRAAIDISDGLALDASRLAEASGCGVVIDLAQIPVSDDAHRLAKSAPEKGTALDHALGDGEDFELLLTVEPKIAEQMLVDKPLGLSISRIGEFVPTKGLWQRDATGKIYPLPAAGYQH